MINGKFTSAELISVLLIDMFFFSRYLILDHMAKDRTQMIFEHLEILHKRGVPAPPTASESLRRK